MIIFLIKKIIYIFLEKKIYFMILKNIIKNNFHLFFNIYYYILIKILLKYNKNSFKFNIYIIYIKIFIILILNLLIYYNYFFLIYYDIFFLIKNANIAYCSDESSDEGFTTFFLDNINELETKSFNNDITLKTINNLNVYMDILDFDCEKKTNNEGFILLTTPNSNINNNKIFTETFNTLKEKSNKSLPDSDLYEEKALELPNELKTNLSKKRVLIEYSKKKTEIFNEKDSLINIRSRSSSPVFFENIIKKQKKK